MSLNATILEDDIVDRIMTFCPTLSTLGSAILVSKTWYNVFQSHPNSITQAVVCNIVGPALPQALRVVRYPYRWFYPKEWEQPEEGDPDRSELTPDDMAEACPEDYSLPDIMEQRELLENAKVMNAFENIYSLTQKDRASKISVLTSQESWRFRRAAYRIMLFCNLFPLYDLDMLSSLERDSIELIRRERAALLSAYPTDELLQFYAIAEFMRDTFATVASSNLKETNCTDDILDAVLGTGPRGVARAWKQRSICDLADELYYLFRESDSRNTLNTEYFTTPLMNIWSARGVEVPAEDLDEHTKHILDTVIGADDTCSQCKNLGGLNLLSEANWGHLSPNLSDLLKNKLKSCSVVRRPFIELTEHMYNSDARGPWIAGMFALKETLEKWDGWERDMSYCKPCLTEFLKDHVWKWFLHERLKGEHLSLGFVHTYRPPVSWMGTTQELQVGI
ncbi:hypothetical protein C8R45DRAFT_1164896 [Mycena sanguinolenta]|nr:hypothetical protein C8R45DRAFT_1164896 [Mycena sanguinolenta]